MHMADALISPIVAGTMYAATAGTMTYSIRKVNRSMDDHKIPLMGVMGAFIFAMQMINFSIPGTGSSGHLGGGMMLAILLGPAEGFLTMACILLIQALFFGDGGLLAYGCNVFNLGFFSCFVAYPLLFRWITRKGPTPRRILIGSLVSAVAALQLGALGVVLETVLSGQTSIPFGTFVLLMQPIHLAIGLVEGFVTSAIVVFLWKARPELLQRELPVPVASPVRRRRTFVGLLVAVLVTGGVLSWFASSDPDGLEWSIEKVLGTPEPVASGAVHAFFAAVQRATSIFSGYTLGGPASTSWPAVDAGTSAAGIIGGLIVLLFAAGIAWILHARRKRKAPHP
jgi:cobalt/nickel transport system permease protein